ncbi:MMPL family transporter [Halostella sp. JP-L12]|uniref:efflux RND transporter permease subunit n=1 Tax=Halostella TaxID=1843185 RepID=UPI000EF7EBD9|nr:MULTISPECIES: MMPL family transporter [Halostella]NHN48413.1 MMPL family transporter [Halostella sp. JP-L12]
MTRNPLDGLIEFVTTHNRIVILLVLALTGAVAVGVTDLQTGSEAADDDTFNDTEVRQKQQYIESNYDARGSENVSVSSVFVREEGGNVLSKASLLDSLRYQRSVRENDSVSEALADDRGTVGVANAVAKRAAENPNASLGEQIETLESMDESEVREAVSATLTEGSPALQLLPNDYEPGTASAESRRIVFRFDAPAESTDDDAVTAAQYALHDEATQRDSAEYFTLGEAARMDANDQYMRNTTELILPVALALILAVLAFSYRDLTDVIVGFAGVLLSLVWMFGILGWLRVQAGMTLIIGPVLIVGLSIDYGLHVFMRYREERAEGEAIRPPMFRSLRSVAVALALVTVTTSIGFLANVTSAWPSIRNLGIGITLGVASAFVIFVTIVPALKVSVDGLLERVGFDRRKRALGHGDYLRPVLASGAAAARKAAPVVIVLALVAGTAGAAAWSSLDRQSFQQQTDEVAEWKQDLPEPLGWERTALSERSEYVDERYRVADEADRRQSQVLVEGDVTSPAALQRVQEGSEVARDSDVAFEQSGSVPVVTPLTVMESVAAENDEFAATLAEADTDGDGVPDRDVEAVYDELYEVAPEEAGRVIERTDGEYRTLRMIVPIEQRATVDAQADAMYEVEDAVDGGEVSATAVGGGTISRTIAFRIADNILETIVLALSAVLVMLMVVYRFATGHASLGAVTVVPIALVTALVVGGMYLLDVPLTLLTALLMSLVIGLGIDYSIHVSDRFAHELDRGLEPAAALRTAVTGTGGALLGSTLTSSGAFAALTLHPHPQFQSLGTLVVLALVTSFLVGVFVLPSLLYVWARYVYADPADADATGTPASTD